MKIWEIKKEFDSAKEKDKWLEDNIHERMYNGEHIAMINERRVLGEDKVYIDSILTV